MSQRCDPYERYNMNFTTDLFLIGILPWFVIVYRLSGKKGLWRRSLLLILANSLFYLSSGVGAFVMICIYATMIRLLSLLISRARSRKILALSVIFTVAPLVFLKYSLRIIDILNNTAGCGLKRPSLILPVGISFITFEAVSLLADIFNGKIDKAPGLLNTWLYLTFFPTVTSGPIIRFDEFIKGLEASCQLIDTSVSIERILTGLFKKVLIADKIAMLADYYFDGVKAGHGYSCAGLWIGSVAYSLQLYYDFSGYSDMAVGIGQLLGFDIRENFNKPYRAESVLAFWKRWHMSLTQWFRDYVYIPLGGNRCSKPRHIFNMLTVWLLTGIWHGSDMTFIIWGLGYFVLLTAEKYLPFFRRLSKGAAGHIYTLFFVNLLWVPFRAADFNTAWEYIRGMFSIGRGILEKKAVHYLPFLLLTALLCFPVDRLLSGMIGEKAVNVFKKISFAVLVFMAVCGIVNSSYAPYIYGNF